jgi:hypothetical protein
MGTDYWIVSGGSRKIMFPFLKQWKFFFFQTKWWFVFQKIVRHCRMILWYQ